MKCLGIFTTSPTSPATTTTTRRHNHHHTRHPHTTREPFEKAQAVFQYDHYSVSTLDRSYLGGKLHTTVSKTT